MNAEVLLSVIVSQATILSLNRNQGNLMRGKVEMGKKVGGVGSRGFR